MKGEAAFAKQFIDAKEVAVPVRDDPKRKEHLVEILAPGLVKIRTTFRRVYPTIDVHDAHQRSGDCVWSTLAD